MSLRVLLGLLLLVPAVACQSPGQSAPSLPADTAASADTLPPAPRWDDRAQMTDGGAVAMPARRQRTLLDTDSLWAEALRIHYNALVVDGHIDTPQQMLDEGYRLAERHPAHASHVDLPRMAEGGLDAAFFALYVAPYYGEGERATQRAFALLDAVKQQLAGDTTAALATDAASVRALARSGRRAILLGLEGGHALAADTAVLDSLFHAGVRYVTLTHVNTNSWADASQSRPRWGGLNDLGRDMVRHMNRLGMLVDLSHTSDSTFFDALVVSQAPVLLSHSSARALGPNVRNASDAMLRALAANGGVVLINFFDAMVNPHLDADVVAEAERRLAAAGQSRRQLWNVLYAVKRERGLPGARLSDVVDHIDHAVQVAGIDHVGLGSDFDGVFDLPSGLEDVTKLPWITYGLLERGYTKDQIYKLLGGNVLRVLEEAQSVAQTLQHRP